MRKIIVKSAAIISFCGAALFLSGCGGGVSSQLVTANVGSVAPPPAVDTAFVVNGRSIYETVGTQAQLSTSSTARKPAALLPNKLYIRGMDYGSAAIGQGSNESPLAANSTAIWQRDLPLIRAMGANAIRVYNSQPPGFDAGTGTMVDFLNAAWNGGSQPVYVVFTIFFTGDKMLNSGAVQALSQQYYALAKFYAAYPAVLGITISNEIGGDTNLANPAWWSGVNTLATSTKQGFRDGGDAGKLVMMAEADGNIGAVLAGEQNKVALDAWGVNVYRGRTLTNLVSQLQAATTKPVLLTEWGVPATYHPSSNAVYTINSGGTASCTYPNPLSSDPNDVAEPTSYANYTDYVANGEKLAYASYKSDGVISGGFYFEWQDEWWKANANASQHTAQLDGNRLAVKNGNYAGCFNDEAWFGLNSLSPGSPLNGLTPRPTLSILQQTWATEN